MRFTGLEVRESPVLFLPTSLIGDELQLGGWQMAEIEATPGNEAATAPALLTEISIGSVDW